MTRKCLFLAVLLILGCKTNHEDSCKVPTQAHGFSYSPREFPVTDKYSVEFFEDIERFKDSSVVWKGSWRDDKIDGSDAGMTPERATKLADSAVQYCFVPVPVFEFRSGTTNYIQIPELTVNKWSNVQAQSKFVAMLVDYVTKYRPPYVFLGNENDFYYESNPADYAHWIITYNRAYDAIKEVSEGTLVGPVFSYEHISGQGLLNGWNGELWEALDQHDRDKIDVVGVTVYPFYNFVNPEDVSSTYLNQLVTKIGSKPIVITETGWPAHNNGNLNPQWITTEEAQVTYVKRLQKMTSGKTIPVVNWLYYNGMKDDGTQSEEWKTFGSISIRDDFGIPYQVYNPWIDL